MAFLADVQRLYERTYGRDAGIELESCVVGPRRCAELAARSGDAHAETHLERRRTFVCHVGRGIDGLRAGPERGRYSSSSGSPSPWIGGESRSICSIAA